MIGKQLTLEKSLYTKTDFVLVYFHTETSNSSSPKIQFLRTHKNLIQHISGEMFRLTTTFYVFLL